MNNTTADVRHDDVRFHFASSLEYYVDSTLKMGNQMSTSNDRLLYEAARDGKLEKVKELLSKGTGTAYRDEVS